MDDSETSASTSNDKKAKRCPNWGESEKLYVIEQVELHRKELFEKFRGATEGAMKKEDCWQSIADALNASNRSNVKRSVMEIKKVYNNSKKRTKEKMDSSKNTGGGPAPSFTPSEQAMFDNWTSRSSAEALGISGGVESVIIGKPQQIVTAALTTTAASTTTAALTTTIASTSTAASTTIVSSTSSTSALSSSSTFTSTPALTVAPTPALPEAPTPALTVAPTPELTVAPALTVAPTPEDFCASSSELTLPRVSKRKRDEQEKTLYALERERMVKEIKKIEAEQLYWEIKTENEKNLFDMQKQYWHKQIDNVALLPIGDVICEQ